MIGGQRAQNADLDMLKKAQDMKAQGVDADTIYADTKWWLDHPDGKPRFEIDDSGAKWKSNPNAEFLPDNLDHPKLDAQYDTERIVLLDDLSLKAKGQYDKSIDAITLGQTYSPDDALSTTLHESQHAIQGREGMARGGNPVMFARDSADAMEQIKGYNLRLSANVKARDEISRDFSMPIDQKKGRLSNLKRVYDGLLDERSKLVETAQLDPYQGYRSLGGEAEARLTQQRMDMGMDERLSNPFYKNYDVPLDEQIIRTGGKNNLSASLPMDEASRMQRARDMGFDTDEVLYHG
ncbi:LPD23 domain-containing protein, partial [Moraxella sp.]|uniref:LPD23 domain-containing protein n=1 Tax=Moraxella sp. TaxID=479 RepID=UPI00261224CA